MFDTTLDDTMDEDLMQSYEWDGDVTLGVTHVRHGKSLFASATRPRNFLEFPQNIEQKINNFKTLNQ